MQTFMYKWTDKSTGMLYIGVHKGLENDGYICSSVYMLEEYKKRPYDFEREILKTFSDYTEARNYEIQYLEGVNASMNVCYYNRSNGYGSNSALPETRKRISESNKGKKKSPQHILNMTIARKNSESHQNHLKRLHKLNLGRKLNPDTKKKMAAAQQRRRERERGI